MAALATTSDIGIMFLDGSHIVALEGPQVAYEPFGKMFIVDVNTQTIGYKGGTAHFDR